MIDKIIWEREQKKNKRKTKIKWYPIDHTNHQIESKITVAQLQTEQKRKNMKNGALS